MCFIQFKYFPPRYPALPVQRNWNHPKHVFAFVFESIVHNWCQRWQKLTRISCIQVSLPHQEQQGRWDETRHFANMSELVSSDAEHCLVVLYLVHNFVNSFQKCFIMLSIGEHCLTFVLTLIHDAEHCLTHTGGFVCVPGPGHVTKPQNDWNSKELCTCFLLYQVGFSKL